MFGTNITSYGTRDSQQQKQLKGRLADLHSCPPSVRTAKSLFVEVTHLGLQNQETNACNK